MGGPVTFAPSENLKHNRERQKDIARRIWEVAIRHEPELDTEAVELVREERDLMLHGEAEA